jgi:hypothetical protein
VAVVWDPAGNADAQIAGIQCHIKLGCHAMNKLAQNVGLK